MASGGNQGSNEGHGNSDSGGGNPGQGGGNPGQGGGREKFEIQIDRAKYEVTKSVMTGAELRAVAPGAPDKKIGDTDRVQMRDGLRFFTAPGQINPGGFWK